MAKIGPGVDGPTIGAASLLEGEEGDQLLRNFPKRLCEKAASSASNLCSSLYKKNNK